MNRSRKTRNSYQNRLSRVSSSGSKCSLCHSVEGRIIESTDNFLIIENGFPYDYWDGQGVVEHLLLLPKKHVKYVKDFKEKEREEFFNHIIEWEEKGYDYYARGDVNAFKSIKDHLHVHFIKLDKKLIKRMFYTDKPYILKAKQ